MDWMIRRIAQLEAMVESLDRRLNNVMRESVVEEVFDDGTATLVSHGGKTKPMPWLQRSGSIQDWDPPTPGERVIHLSPGGHLGRGLILPGGYTEQFPQPHNKLGESRRKVGDSMDTFSGSQRVIESQLIILRGTVRIEGPLEIEGSSVTHNNVNIGDTHVHGGVERGGSDTDEPH